MRSREPEASALSRWTSRLALFCLLLVIVVFILHRLFGMPTPVAANAVMTALAGSAVAVLLGIAASVRIWRHGGGGAARILVGLFVALLLLSGPLVLMAMARSYPAIYDVTTDVASPPPFDVLAMARTPDENKATYPAAFARQQQTAYPDLKPLNLNRSQSEAFELVVDALKRQGLTVVRQQEPKLENATPGYIEAVDRTLVLGLYGDVAVRVTGSEQGARVDLRSASRYGSADFGINAERLRTIMREIVARMEETVPTADGERPERAKDKSRAKPEKEGNPKTSRARKPRRPVQ
jgi:uncharacterized protein (DUF1499 family)